MKQSSLLVLIFNAVLITGFSQQLMINEVSQGTGTAEYVEFVVVGNPICENDPVPCIDIRKVIFDDNNGYFSPGLSFTGDASGFGIAQGALRFSNDPLWSCIPQGTFIIIYNEQSPNASLPADDISTTDGNCTIVIPGNSSLLESPVPTPVGESFGPTANPFNPFYPQLDVNWGPSTGWSSVAMANSGDSFQIPNLGINGSPLHSVSWGNNNLQSIIYFAGPAAGLVFSFKNIVSNDFNDQQNWLSENVAGAQTPGLPNSPENDYWIGTMNPSCRALPVISVTSSDAACGVSDGSATVSTDGIVGNFSINWSTGANSSTISNLDGGVYTVEVTDEIGCIYQSTAVVNESNAPTVSTTVVDEACVNSCTGSITLNVSGGAIPYTFSWSSNVLSFTDNVASNLCSDQYTATVTDANGCAFSVIENVSATSPMLLSFVTTTSDCGAATGSATVTVNGGSGNYSFQWGASAGNQTTATATNLPSGVHQLTVNDLTTLCQQVADVTILNQNGISTSVFTTPLTCEGSCNASAAVSVSGGALPYTYLWDAAAGNQTTASVSNLCVGTYTCTISDNNGCISVENVTVSNPVPVSFTVSTTDASCDYSCDGGIQITPSGGIAPYTLLVFSESGEQLFTFNNLCVGNYTVNVGDVLGCTTSDQTVSVISATPISYVKSPDRQICLGEVIEIGIAVTAGTPVLVWSDNSSNDTMEVSPVVYTEYSFTLSEGSCTVSDVIRINVIDCTIPPVDSSVVVLPNIFTPDSDNKNDFYIPLILSNIQVQSFVILNRWGNLMAEFNDQNIKWDGMVNGKEASEGTYFYKFTYTDVSGSSKTDHGFFQLVR